MAEVLDVLNAFPMPIKAAWLVWLLWGASQLLWYRQGRVAIVRQLPAPRPRPRRPVKPIAPPLEPTAEAAGAEPLSSDSRVA